MKINFKITFKKGVVGKSNDLYTDSFKPECAECGYDMVKGEPYYYWGTSENFNYEASPTIDDDEYILCKKCADKKR